MEGMWKRWASIFVAATLTMACAHTDAGITAKIKAKMIADERVRASQIEVETHNGSVTLTGNIDSEDAKQRALTLAKETKGVVSVKDMIEVREASGRGEAPDPHRRLGVVIDDAGITMRVKGHLLDDPTVKGLRIDVDTREGVVFLTGTVRSETEKNRAIELARQTEGVKDVQPNLKIEGKS